MGSRGSGSGRSGVGKHGAGMTGGRGEGGNPQNAKYLTDQIGRAGGTQFADEIMSTRDDLENTYGEGVKNVTLMTADMKEGTLGCYMPATNTVYMNNKYVNNPELTAAMQKAAKSGFHPSIGTYTGAEAVAAHELGHGMADYIEKKKGVNAKTIVSGAAKTLGIKPENMAGFISGYARTNYHETIAEACADVYCNGSKATKQSKAIMAEVQSYMS